jgi:hypothetical protein
MVIRQVEKVLTEINEVDRMIRFQQLKCFVMAVILLGLTACGQHPVKESASSLPVSAPEWETLAYSYAEPLPFPILDKLRSKAQVSYHERDYQSTHLLLDQMFRVDPKRPDIMALKGWVFCKQAQYDEAALWLQRARGFLDSSDGYDALLAKAERDCRL